MKPTVVWVKISEEKNYQLFHLEISLPKASNQKESYFGTKKVRQTCEERNHCHCRHVTF